MLVHNKLVHGDLIREHSKPIAPKDFQVGYSSFVHLRKLRTVDVRVLTLSRSCLFTIALEPINCTARNTRRLGDKKKTSAMDNRPSSQPIGAAMAAEAAIAKIYQLRTEEDSQEPLQISKQLLEPWKESSSNLLQPAALERLNDSLIMSVLIAKGWDNLLELLLSLGLQIRGAQMSAAIHHAKEVKSFGALKLLFKSVWDINRPLNDSCPPAIRYVVLRDRQRSQPGLTG